MITREWMIKRIKKIAEQYEEGIQYTIGKDYINLDTWCCAADLKTYCKALWELEEVCFDREAIAKPSLELSIVEQDVAIFREDDLDD